MALSGFLKSVFKLSLYLVLLGLYLISSLTLIFLVLLGVGPLERANAIQRSKLKRMGFA